MSRFASILFVSYIISLISGADNYWVYEESNCNNIYGAVQDPDSGNEWVTLLGVFDTVDDCINACIANSTSNNLCETYTWHDKNYAGGWAKHCFARFGYPLWTPIIDSDAYCGRIIWKCKDDSDCFLNGKCNTNTGNCTCNTAWSGPKCDILNLLPATKNTGYNASDTNNNKKISSWGGLFNLY